MKEIKVYFKDHEPVVFDYSLSLINLLHTDKNVEKIVEL